MSKEDISRKMAGVYAKDLYKRLGGIKSTYIDDDSIDNPTSLIHLKNMCLTIQMQSAINPDDYMDMEGELSCTGTANSSSISRKIMSTTKLHRWIGYVQGVMICRGLSTVQEERSRYKNLKSTVIKGDFTRH